MGLADDFLAEASQKPNDHAGIDVLAKYFDRLVREDLRRYLDKVSPGERKILASTLAQRLGKVESEASRLAVAWQASHPKSADALQRIATSARAADRRLRLEV